jgi:hypothetical protein
VYLIISGAGAELPLALGGPGPPHGQGSPPKKKKKLINFTPKFCYFYSFSPPKFFFSIWPPQILDPSSAPDREFLQFNSTRDMIHLQLSYNCCKTLTIFYFIKSIIRCVGLICKKTNPMISFKISFLSCVKSCTIIISLIFNNFEYNHFSYIRVKILIK